MPDGARTTTTYGRGLDSPVLNIYFDEVRNCPPISREEEQALAKRAQANDAEARDRLISANLRFVISVAMSYRGCGVPLEDLVGAGNYGLMKAVDRFNPDRGLRFISYAVWWIRQAIQHAIANDPRVVRLPRNRVELLQGASRSRRKLEQACIAEPRVEDLAEDLGVSVGMLEDTLAGGSPSWSLDEAASEGDSPPVEWLEAPYKDGPEETFESANLRIHVKELLESLGPRDAQVLRLAFGLDDYDPHSLAEIGELMGLSRERVRQIKCRALKRLQAAETLRELRHYEAA